MKRGSEQFHTGGNAMVGGNLIGIGFAGAMIGIASRVVYGGPIWLAFAIGVPAVAILLSGVFLEVRARRMRVVLDEDGLRCSDWLGRSETVAWREVRGLELWNRTIPFSGGALDLSWEDVRGREHTRRIASFDPPRGLTVSKDVNDLIEAVEQRLALQHETVRERHGSAELVSRWERGDEDAVE